MEFDFTSAGQALAAAGAAAIVIWFAVPNRIASALDEHTGSFGLLVSGIVAILAGALIVTAGG